MSEPQTAYRRLEEQISWLDRKSHAHQRWYRRLKVVSIAAAALVPLVSGIAGFNVLAGLLGVVVVVVEGLQHVNQHHENWIRYRATCENLRHEKYLYLGRTLAYTALSDDDAMRLLVANVEAILANEGDAWVKLRRNLEQEDGSGAQRSPD